MDATRGAPLSKNWEANTRPEVIVARHGIDTDALPTYLHVFEDGRRVPAKACPESLLADFRHFQEEWLPNRALDYFRSRDSEALQYLSKLIAHNEPKKLN